MPIILDSTRDTLCLFQKRIFSQILLVKKLSHANVSMLIYRDCTKIPGCGVPAAVILLVKGGVYIQWLIRQV